MRFVYFQIERLSDNQFSFSLCDEETHEEIMSGDLKTFHTLEYIEVGDKYQIHGLTHEKGMKQ